MLLEYFQMIDHVEAVDLKAGTLVARSVVPVSHTGMLRVRGKFFDMLWMTLLGVALIVLALVIPEQPGR